MENFKEFLIPTRFSLYGYIVAVSNLLCGTILSAVTGSLRASERRNIHCNVGSKSPFDKNFLRASCFDQYEQKYNSPLPLFGFPLLSFSMLTIICIVYSWCCVKSRVEEVEEACKFDAENPRPRATITTRRVFSCYFTQLIVRLTLGILFVYLQKCVLYPCGFPNGFLCELKLEKSKVTETDMTLTNSTFFECQNSMGSDKTVWAMIMFIVNILIAFLVAGEIIYLIFNLLKNNTFMQDSEFCQRYLFNQRKTSKRMDQFRMNQKKRIIKDTELLEPLIPPTPGENEGYKNLDDVYVDLIIHTGRSRYEFDLERMDKLEILKEYLKSPQNAIRIKTEELILPNEDSSHPRKILIIGGPGVGKTLLCEKFLRDLSKGEKTEQGTTKFRYMYLFHFRHFNSEDLKSMSLQTLLSHGKYSEGKINHENFQSILEHPEKILLVFDGLDEFKYHERCMEEEREHAGNGVADVMPFSALYVKLVQGKILSGATVLTTSRPHVMDSVRGLIFDRTVEIMGFSKEKVEEYCTKFSQPDPNVKERIWQHVQGNLNLLYLCYIPVNCFIVCSLLEKIIKLAESPLEGVTLPTTLTEIYKGALRMFIFKHHPEYKGKTLKRTDLLSNGTFSSSVEKTLSKLELLAVKGIEQRRLVFESEEVEGMEDCGLLKRMPDILTAPFSYKPQFCFIHLTMQEFVAARHIVKMDVEKLKEFISSKSNNAKWHLVIQFVAGLLKAKEIVIKKIFVRLLQDSLISNNGFESLFMMKCLYELNDINVVKRAAGELKSNSKFTNRIKFQQLNLTPVDCTAIVHFLRHIDTLESLDFQAGHLGIGGCSELSKLIAEGRAKEMHFDDCGIDDQSFVPILEAMKSKTSKLLHLLFYGNKITDDGFSSLCDTLVDENCKVTGLRIAFLKIPDKHFASLKLGNALKHKNCKLTKLYFSWHKNLIHVRGNDDKMCQSAYANLFSALVSENCKLTELILNDIPSECLPDLFEALKHENCKLTQFKFRVSIISDEGLLHCCEALQHVNFNFTELWLVNVRRENRFPFTLGFNLENKKNSQSLLIIMGDICITDEGISHLCNAIKNENCKLTRFSICGCVDHTAITNEVVKGLENALKHENSKLEVFRWCRKLITPLEMPIPRAQHYYPNYEVDCRILNLNSHSLNVLARNTVQHVGLWEEKGKALLAQDS